MIEKLLGWVLVAFVVWLILSGRGDEAVHIAGVLFERIFDAVKGWAT